MIATAFQLAGPLIAKKIIDDHIVGIEGLWHEVERNQDRFTVTLSRYIIINVVIELQKRMKS